MTDAQIHERCVQVYLDRMCAVDGRDEVVPVLEELYMEAFGKGKMVASQAMIEIVKSEEEMDGEMPEILWAILTTDRTVAATILRTVVRTVKKNVLEKFAATLA